MAVRAHDGGYNAKLEEDRRNWRGVRCGVLADWTSVYVRSGGQMRPRGR
jgi:hypothetical protein